jgi:hypothetical protein
LVYQLVNFPLLLKEGWPQHNNSQGIENLVAAGVVDCSIDSKGIENNVAAGWLIGLSFS